jgi:hypothetical protein
MCFLWSPGVYNYIVNNGASYFFLNYIVWVGSNVFYRYYSQVECTAECFNLNIVVILNLPHFEIFRSILKFLTFYKDLKMHKIALKYLKNNLRSPFENCAFTPLFYRITQFATSVIL